MKRITAILISLLMAISVLVGCQSPKDNKKTNKPDEDGNGEYKVAILDASDSVSGNTPSSEYSFYDYETYKDVKDKSTTVKLTVNGEEKVFNCTPQTASFIRRNYYPVFKHGNIWLNINGKPECYMDFKAINAVETAGIVPESEWCGETKAIEAANEFAAQIVDTTKYKVHVEIPKGNANSYTVYFTKYIGDVKTTEQLEITVGYNGMIMNYVADMLDQFTGNEKNPFDMDKVKEIAHARLYEAYGKEIASHDRIDIDSEDYRLTKLKDGSFAVLCEIRTSLIDVHENGDELRSSGPYLEVLITK